jgi:hypothetical protein
VRDDEAAEAVAELAEIVELGDHEIDAEQARVGKHHPAVDGDRLAFVLEYEAVEADLAETTQGDDAQGSAHAPAALARRVGKPLRGKEVPHHPQHHRGGH